jgi:hypothetical protein
MNKPFQQIQRLFFNSLIQHEFYRLKLLLLVNFSSHHNIHFQVFEMFQNKIITNFKILNPKFEKLTCFLKEKWFMACFLLVLWILFKVTILSLKPTFLIFYEPVHHGSIYPTFTSFFFVKEDFVQHLKLHFIWLNLVILIHNSFTN